MSTPLLTLDDVAAHLRVTTRTVYRLIERDGLRSVMVGSRLRIRQEDLDAWVAGQVRQQSASTVTSGTRASPRKVVAEKSRSTLLPPDLAAKQKPRRKRRVRGPSLSLVP